MRQFALFLTCIAAILFFPVTSYADKFTPAITIDKQAVLGSPVYVRIFKEERTLELYVKQNNKFVLLDTYPICKFSGGLGPKTRESDFKSPEGFYKTHSSHLNPNSNYHLSFNIGYPNEFDQYHGYTGNYLMIHGDCVSQGCYAMGNSNIEEIYLFIQKALNNGQSSVDIHIYPFRMTDQNMRRHSNSKYYSFWRHIQPGYRYFEKWHLPPVITTQNGRYVFSPQRGTINPFLSKQGYASK